MLTFAFWALAVVGAIVLLIGGFAVVCVALLAFNDWRSKSTSSTYGNGYVDALNRLRNDAWWFSESPETCELLQDLANRMHVEAARSKWRKAREAALFKD